MSAAPVKRGFADRLDIGSNSIAKVEDLRAIDRQPRNPFASNATEFIDRSPFNPISGAAATGTENLLPRSATKTMRRVFEPVKRTESGNWSIAGKEKRIRQGPGVPLPESRLSTGLQEYWQLNKHQQSNALHEDGPRGPTPHGATGFSQTSHIFPERSLAELTGQPLLDKIDALTFGLAVRKAGVNQPATNNSDLLPHVEIQNTFHVEVKNGPAGLGFGDLSDKVADILREQALQHGIDIT